MISTPEQQAVDAAITSRRSIRAYLPQAVAREDILQILQVAGRAPSGTNTQPWKVYVCAGQVRDALSRDLLADGLRSLVPVGHGDVQVQATSVLTETLHERGIGHDEQPRHGRGRPHRLDAADPDRAHRAASARRAESSA